MENDCWLQVSICPRQIRSQKGNRVNGIYKSSEPEERCDIEWTSFDRIHQDFYCSIHKFHGQCNRSLWHGACFLCDFDSSHVKRCLNDFILHFARAETAFLAKSRFALNLSFPMNLIQKKFDYSWSRGYVYSCNYQSVEALYLRASGSFIQLSYCTPIETDFDRSSGVLIYFFKKFDQKSFKV